MLNEGSLYYLSCATTGKLKIKDVLEYRKERKDILSSTIARVPQPIPQLLQADLFKDEVRLSVV